MTVAGVNTTVNKDMTARFFLGAGAALFALSVTAPARAQVASGRTTPPPDVSYVSPDEDADFDANVDEQAYVGEAEDQGYAQGEDTFYGENEQDSYGSYDAYESAPPQDGYAVAPPAPPVQVEIYGGSYYGPGYVYRGHRPYYRGYRPYYRGYRSYGGHRSYARGYRSYDRGHRGYRGHRSGTHRSYGSGRVTVRPPNVGPFRHGGSITVRPGFPFPKIERRHGRN